jgi:arsenate reductase (thioredoxin)
MRTILFICEHNSARSQMAQAYLNYYAEGSLHAESAGLEPGALNPLALEVLREDGIDIAGATTRSVFDLYKSGKHYDAVISVCSPAVDRKCPLFPGRMLRQNWSFDDPSSFTGTKEERLQQTRIVRDQIKQKVRGFIAAYRELGLKLFVQ